MATKYSTPDRTIGEVTTNLRTIRRIEISAGVIDQDNSEVDEFLIVLNGRVIARMSPNRAIRFGLINGDSLDRRDW